MSDKLHLHDPLDVFYSDYTQSEDVPESVQDINVTNMQPTALSTQVGGSHYTKCGIQPAEYAIANNFNYWQSHVLRYITRFRDKGGKQDLLKAMHAIQMLIEAEYGESNT